MKKIIITATVMCLSICLWAQGNKGITASRLAEGDLLFCVAESGNNITDVTTGLDGRQIDHVAIYHNAGGKGFALEAIHKGVCLTPIDSFMARRHVVVVGQLKDTVGVARSVERAMLFIGTPYDFNFMPSDSAMYCSELVQKCYRSRDGELVFKPIPMSFHDKTGTNNRLLEGLLCPSGIEGARRRTGKQSRRLVEKRQDRHSGRTSEIGSLYYRLTLTATPAITHAPGWGIDPKS